MTFEEILSRFEGPKKPNGQGGFLVRCPAHADERGSLSLSPGNGKGTLFKCHAGCETERVLEIVGLSWQDVFPPRDRPVPRAASRIITVSDLAADKGIPEHFLRSLGIEDRSDGMLIPYRKMDGSPAVRQRLRKALSAKEGSTWLPGEGSPVPYGLDRLEDAQERGFLILAEGESDCWALWHRGFPALGIPGADMTGKIEAKHLSGIDRVYFWREPDKGGDTLAAKLPVRLREIGFTGEILEVKIDGVKDPADLYRKDPAGFDQALGKALDTAREIGTISASPDEFPAHVMAGLAGDFADLYGAHLEAPKHFFFMSFLSCLGNLLADKVTLESELYPQPRLFMLLLGESADDRKSTAIAKTVDFFKGTTTDFPVCFGVGSAEGLQARLEQNNRLLLCFDEFRQFVSKCRIEGSVLLPCVNTLFESGRYESRTKSSEVILRNVFLSLLGASTIATYENTWSTQFTDIGFNNRLWLVPGGAKRRFSIPPAIPEMEKFSLKKRLGQVLQHAESHRRLTITPDAAELYDTWYMNQARLVHSKRLDVYAMRFMILLTVNELKTEVDVQTVRKVIALCNHQYAVRILYDPVDADSEVAKMEEKIRRVLTAKGPLSERDVKREVHASRKGLWLYNSAKGNLYRADEIGFNRAEKKYFLRGES